MELGCSCTTLGWGACEYPQPTTPHEAGGLRGVAGVARETYAWHKVGAGDSNRGRDKGLDMGRTRTRGWCGGRMGRMGGF